MLSQPADTIFESGKQPLDVLTTHIARDVDGFECDVVCLPTSVEHVQETPANHAIQVFPPEKVSIHRELVRGADGLEHFRERKRGGLDLADPESAILVLCHEVESTA
jgi:hypothetical protein